MLEGIRYVRARPDLLLVMVIVFFVGTFGLNFQMTSALMATAVFGKGAGAYGLLGSVVAIGSLSGALLAARRGRPRLRLIVLAAVAFGVVEVAAGLMPTYLSFMALLIPLGLCQMTLLNAANATMQLGVDPVMRGRVMALYMAVLMGGTPIGAPLVGALAEAFGARWSLIARRPDLGRCGDRGRLRCWPVGRVWCCATSCTCRRPAAARPAVRRRRGDRAAGLTLSARDTGLAAVGRGPARMAP